MKKIIQLYAIFYVLCASALATLPTAIGEWEIGYRDTTGMKRYGFTAENGKAIGFTGGVPAMVTLGGMATTDIDTSAELRAILTDESGTGALLFAGGALGAATAVTINGLAITANGGNTLSIVAGKTFAVANTITLNGTDGSTLSIGAGGTLGTAAYTASTAYDVAGAAAAVTPTTLNLLIGTNVQGWNLKLDTFAALANGSGVLTNNGAGVLSWGAGGGGITVGTSAITSGTAGRLLFEGAGNVVSEDADLTFATDTLTATKISSTGPLSLTGVASNGVINLPAQSSGTVATPASGFALFANSAGKMSWIRTDGFIRTFDAGGPAADVTWTMPSTTATIARTDAAQTFTGVQSMTSPDITTSLTTPSSSFTALAGATTLLTLGGTGATATLTIPGTEEATGTAGVGALNVAGGGNFVKKVYASAFNASAASAQYNGLQLFGDTNQVRVGNGAAGSGGGSFVTAIGSNSGAFVAAGNYNTFIGWRAGRLQADGVTPLAAAESSIYIGAKSLGFSDADSNAIVIGVDAIGQGANTTVIGTTSTTASRIYGTLTLGQSTGTATSGALILNGSTSGSATINVSATGGLQLGTPTTLTLTNATGLPLTTGVTGTLPLANGGTAATTAKAARVNLGNDVYTGVADTNYTALTTDRVISWTSITAPRVLTLPAASSMNAGQELIIGDISGSCSLTNTITVTRAGSDTIDGATAEVIAAAYAKRRLISDGVSKWGFDKGVGRLAVAASWPALQTMTGTNFTGIPISTGISGLGTGVAATLATNLSITGGGTISLGGFTFTVPATGTAALLGTANTFTALNTFSGGTNSATPTNLHLITNTTAATVGLQSASPSTIWTGAGWKTNATAGSQPVSFRAYVLPVQGAANPTATWTLGSDINATGTYTDRMSVTSTGMINANALNLNLTGGLAPSGIGIGVSSSAIGAVYHSGVASASWNLTGFFTRSDFAFLWSASTTIDGTNDTGLFRPAAGVVSFNTNSSTVGGTWRSIPRTPAATITSNQDNYNPGGTSHYQRWSTDASRNVTGMTFTAAQVDGQTHVIVNVGSFDIVLKHLTTSTAGNQFQCTTGADITLTPNQEANCWYDSTTAKWRVSKRN